MTNRLAILTGLLAATSPAWAASPAAGGPASPATAVAASPGATTTAAGAELARIDRLFGEAKFGEAERALRKLGKEAPSGALALAMARQGRYADAARQIEAEAAARNEQVDPRLGEGWWLLAAKWQAPPIALQAHARGVWHLEAGRLPEAAEAFSRALALAPGLADAAYRLAFVRTRQGDLPGAERLYRVAIERYSADDRPLRGSAEFALASLLRSAGPERLPEVVALLRSALAPESRGRDPVLLVALGGALLASGDQDGGRSAMSEALEVSLRRGGLPMNVISEVGGRLLVQGCRPRPAGAGPGVPPTCAAEPANLEVARALEALGGARFAEAADHARAALALDGQHAGARVFLGRALAGQQLWDAAAVELRQALQGEALLHPVLAAMVKLDLASALLRSDKDVPDLVLLAEDAAEVAERPEDVAASQELIGRAFAHRGNMGCAIERLQYAAALPGVGEKLRTRLNETLAQARKEAEGDKSASRCFEYELYRPSTLAGARARYLKLHPPAKDRLGAWLPDYVPPERFRVKLKDTGTLRPLSPERVKEIEKQLRSQDSTRGIPSYPGGQVRREAEVNEEGIVSWLPIEEGLLPVWKEEQPDGGTAEFFLLRLGSVGGEPVFVITELRTEERIRPMK